MFIEVVKIYVHLSIATVGKEQKTSLASRQESLICSSYGACLKSLLDQLVEGELVGLKLILRRFFLQ